MLGLKLTHDSKGDPSDHKHSPTRMWNMISSPATPTVCPEQESENFQSHNVKQIAVAT